MIDGDPAAVLERYRAYLSTVVRLTLNRLDLSPSMNVRVEAEEIVQEVMFAAHRFWAKIHATTEPQLMAWLKQVARRKLQRKIRHESAEKRDPQRESQVPIAFDESSRLVDVFVATHSTPSRRAAREEQSERIASALARLREDYREVIVLHFFEGQSLQQIAVTMKKSRGMVAGYLARATKLLRNDETLEHPE